ncbi:MAG: glycosyltransferase [Betaproteobacteria bacterium]|nr:glycosyltransferase [Betaproteobacteria bacterium]
MIRVLTFGRFADDNFGGLERYVFELGRALEGEVSFVNVVARRGPRPDVPTAGETVYARSVANLGDTPICPGMPLHALRRHWRAPFDIVHLQFPADPMAHLACELLPGSVKRVIGWHSDIVRQQGLLRLYRPFLNYSLRRADAIIAATPAHISSSAQLAPVRETARFHIVPYGFDLARFRDRPALADEIRRRHAGRFLLFALGRHVYYKGFEFLIRALASIPQARLALGGQGPLTPELQRIAREAGVAERVEFLGRIPDRDLPAWYHACDVFCLPSVEPAEAFGIVQVEAMACARPVVCCQLHNGVNWVNRDGETGLAVPAADPAALAVALTRLQKDAGLRVRLGEEGRRRAFSVFSAEAMASGTLAVYREVLSRL